MSVIVLGILLGGAVVAVLLAVRAVPGPRTAAADAAPLATVRTGYRWCPAELRTRAAMVHADGSATCADPDCGTHIPATEEESRA